MKPRPKVNGVSNPQNLQISGTETLPAVNPTDITAPSQHGRPFMPGRSGNPGHPERVAEQADGNLCHRRRARPCGAWREVLEKLRKTDLEAHLKIVGRLVLRELVLERERDPNFADMTEDEVVELLDRARRNDLVRSYPRQIAKPGEPSLP